MKPSEFLKYLRANGRYTFTTNQADNAFGTARPATLNILKWLKPDICSPAKGFYIIVPPEYQTFGCLPAEMFIHELMDYFGDPYYVGFLSAAQYYGAAHQKPQYYQILTTRSRRRIQCGRVFIEFIKDKDMATHPTKPFNTLSGTISVATPETLAIALVSSLRYAAGIDNAATVLSELADQLDPKCLAKRIDIGCPISSLQRLGYLFDLLLREDLSAVIFRFIQGKKTHWVQLSPDNTYVALERNKKWKVLVNTRVETDI